MLVAHLPSGYLLGAVLAERCEKAPASIRAIFWVCVIGAIAPDFDLFYHYLIDAQSTHHHRYFTHWPIVWLTAAALSFVWWRFFGRGKAAFLALLFCLAALLHLALDSFVGDIWWLAPFVDKPYALFTVPARFQPWWWSFILHWSFLVELAIVVWAAWVLRARSKTP